ncbi:MAG: sigma-70 family RNA polymerase sigma factor [Planctomycetes bacterium]|nr:sigma-70 family RNA polymerase sigma factor [Planctomycetota bacterium]
MEDAILIWRLKRGDIEALSRIYEKYESDMLAAAVHLLGDTHAAKDIVHDVFVKFALFVHKRSIYGSLQSFLITSVVNAVRDWMRHCQRVRTTLEDCPEAAVADDPAGHIIADETARKLSEAMGQLPYEQREVITLHIQCGMRFKTIARHLAISLNTVQSRYRYGLQKLRSLLNSEVES